MRYWLLLCALLSPALLGAEGGSEDRGKHVLVFACLSGPIAPVSGSRGIYCDSTDGKLRSVAPGGATADLEASGGGGGGPTTLVSSSTVSDAVIATQTAIPGLSFTAAASTRYLIDCYIIYTSTVTTTGIKFAWDTPASPTRILMGGVTPISTAGGVNAFLQRADDIPVATTTGVNAITVEQIAYLHTLFQNGSNAGTTSLGFTPETANSVSVVQGSVCQYRAF